MMSDDCDMDDLRASRWSAIIVLGLGLASWAVIGGALVLIVRALA